MWVSNCSLAYLLVDHTYDPGLDRRSFTMTFSRHGYAHLRTTATCVPCQAQGIFSGSRLRGLMAQDTDHGNKGGVRCPIFLTAHPIAFASAWYSESHMILQQPPNGKLGRNTVESDELTGSRSILRMTVASLWIPSLRFSSASHEKQTLTCCSRSFLSSP